MASVFTDRKGNPVLQFVAANGRRKSISLAGEKKRTISQLKGHVEELVAAQKAARTPYDETNTYIGKLGVQLYQKLVRAGLVPERDIAKRATLGPFLDDYLAKQTNLKESTRTKLRQTRDDLVACFGAERPLADITEGHAEDFRSFLRRRPNGWQASHKIRRDPKKRKTPAKKPFDTTRKLEENTIRRSCGRAKQLLGAAVKHRLIDRNPFDVMKGLTVKGNKARDYFISREEAQKVLDACPDLQWRLIFALCRYGGLRCPSELRLLRWGDIDWEGGTMIVHSPKTEHHDGKESRVMPLFPELRRYLEVAWDEAEPGTEYVITGYREANANLRTQLKRIIKRAGLIPWPKLFQNLRSTRETELRDRFPSHVVCAWIGHSERVANEHYLQVTDTHVATAATEPTGKLPDLHPALQSGAVSNGPQSPAISDTSEKPEKDNSCSVFSNLPVAEAGVEPARGLLPNGF